MSSNRTTPDRLEGRDASVAATNSDAPLDESARSSKPAVRKDRNCPFCHQTFTSSSLGRHLDSFIRDKSPKPQDGVHDLPKIRKMRENITRRHTRVPPGAVVDTSSRRWSVTSIVSPKANTRVNTVMQHLPKSSGSIDQSMSQHGYEMPVTVPTRNWTATGVIPNLPPKGYSSPLPRILPRPEASVSQGPPTYANMEDMDDARAAELALREVLHAVRSAATGVDKPALFDFDFYAYNFPALCVRLLQAPAALFSSTPMPGSATWPLSIPSQTHFAALQEHLRDRIKVLHDKRADSPLGGSAPDSRRQSTANALYQPEFKPFVDHLDTAYQHWQTMSETQKHEVWHLETLRAYAQETEQRQSLQSYVDRLQADADSLRRQLEDFRSRKQSWQQGGIIELPKSIPVPLPKGVVQAISSHVDLNDWDYDKLIAKHKPSVQKARRQSTSGTNDIRNAHERAVSSFGPSDSLLLRPMMGPHGTGESMRAGTPKSGHGTSERDDDSQDGDGEIDPDIDMDDVQSAGEGGPSRTTNRHGLG